MKVLVYNMRDYDEKRWFDYYSRELGIEYGVCYDDPSLENARLAEGCQCLSVITPRIPAELVQAFYDRGVRYISTRTIGYDHIDIKKCRELGIRVGNAVYGPEGVAEYTIMLMLMSIRKMKRIMQRAEIQDFTLKGNQGRELHDFTVGVLGTGRIGRTVVRLLHGFGCKVLAYDKYPCSEAKQYAEYVSLDEILRRSDLISLHMPLFDDTFHIIDKEAIGKMKEHAVIVNTGRGALIDSEALISGLESGKIGAAGLDVVEQESGLYYNDLKFEPLANRQLAILRGFPNVIVTPHMAFYTENAVGDMVGHSMKSCKCFMTGQDNPWEVK